MNLSPATKSELAVEATTWAEKARGLRIVDATSCVQASHLLRSIKGLRTEIANWFAPHVERAMDAKRKAEEARKGLTDERDRMEQPLVEAEAVIKRSLLAYEQEQERLRQAEEARLQREAQAEAERLTLEAAAALEREGMATGDAGMVQEAEDILAQPIEAPVVSVRKTMPKVQGVAYRDNWKAHPQIDVKALAAAVAAGKAPVTFLLPNLTAINQHARATQGTQPIAGVRFFNDRQIAARG